MKPKRGEPMSRDIFGNKRKLRKETNFSYQTSDMKTIKLTTFNDLGDCDRQDVNDLMSALVRMGYEVWMADDSVCFNLGNDDAIKDEKNENNRA